MDSTHEFLDTVADSMTAVVNWFHNPPKHLLNLRRMAISLDMSPFSTGPSASTGGQLLRHQQCVAFCSVQSATCCTAHCADDL